MIPTPDTVDAAWLTEQLQANGFNSSVTSFTQERVGTGQLGMCIRYTLQTTGDDAPASLIGKFPSPDPLSSATGVQLRNYIKEVCFYREMQHRISINTPRCYYADIIDEGPHFMLLLEDLSPAVQGDQLAGCNAEIANAAVMELVGLHAPLWQDASLREKGFLAAQPGEGGSLKPLYMSLFPGFVDRYGEHLNKDQVQILETLGEHVDHYQRVASTTVFSPIHIDYRLDNIMIDSQYDSPRIIVVDWQSITLGSPLTDVGYFIGAGMLPEERRQSDTEIVRNYYDGLIAAGVSDYSFEQCWQDYRLSSFAGFTVTVVASMLVQRTDRGDDMFTVMAQRHSQHALDLDAAELIVDHQT
jgi:hypothetical protein